MKQRNNARIATSVMLMLLSASRVNGAESRPRVFHTVDVQIPSATCLVKISGKRHLAYELHITNFRSTEVTLTTVEVLDGDHGPRLGTFGGTEINDRLWHPGARGDGAGKRTMGAGMRAVFYVWLTLDESVPTPSMLRHKIGLDIVRDSKTEHVVVNADTLTRLNEPPIVLNPPLRGGPWVAIYDPTLIGGHRTAIYAVNGRARIPARFAIDWVKLDHSGKRARGDESQVANWYGYGAEVLAAADAIVVEAMDDLPEKTSFAESSEAPMPLENVSGNYVCLDLGGGRFAFYEHLQHKSIRVKAGDRVESGQILALLGNSGSTSSGPHLHFHVGDGKSELASEGLPYAFKDFEVLGAFESIEAIGTGQRWNHAPSDWSGVRRSELPAPMTVVNFKGK